MHLDASDRLAAATLDGYLVRKDLVRTFSRQFPVPTDVVGFLLGRYCASTDPEEIDEGLEIVQRQLADRTVKAGEEELFKSRAEEKPDGSIEPVHNAVTVAEMAVEKGATALLMPVACRRQLFDLSDDMATKVDIQFYTDGREALLKAIQE